MILKVKKGGSIKGPDNKVYKGGTVIPNGLLTEAMIKEHLASGYLSVLRSPKSVVPTLAEVRAAGYSEEAAKSIVADAEAAAGEELVEFAPGVEDVPGMSDTGKPVKVASKWALDPDALRGVELDQLNVMIIERDAEQQPFDSVEEAIAWLSQDYEEPKLASKE